MDPPYRGYGDYEQEEHRHSPFHHRPPPPPADDFFGERPCDERREDDEGGFPRRHSRPEEEHFGRDDEGGFPRRHSRPEEEHFGREDDGFGRRGDHERERFGKGEHYGEGYPPEGRHFPHMGFGRPPHTEGSPPEEFEPARSEDAENPPHHSFMHFGSHHGQRPSDEHVAADRFPEAPAAEAALTSQLDSLSLDLPQGRLVRIFCKQNSSFNLAVEHNSLEMQESKPEDESQQWIKDVSHGTKIKDSYGYPAFSLVNKKTKKVLKHTKEQGQQVLLVDYQPDLKDDNILWTESQDFGEGFKTVRCASDTLLNLTVFEGHKKIRNGSAIMLDSWHKGDHQQWKLFAL